jgi:hypothetical protein
VLQQRSQGPDTIVDGIIYKGLRFCVLLKGNKRCGVRKVQEWNRRMIPPTCIDCLEAASDAKKAWFAAWPENKDYFEFIKYQVEQVGHLTQHKSQRVRGRITVSSAANSYFQGLAADCSKAALVEVCKAQYNDPSSVLYGSHTICFAHDELIGECDIDRGHEVATEVAATMVRVGRQWIPDVLVAAEPTLMFQWDKKASLVRNSDGRIQPWNQKQ